MLNFVESDGLSRVRVCHVALILSSRFTRAQAGQGRRGEIGGGSLSRGVLCYFIETVLYGGIGDLNGRSLRDLD